MGWSGSARAACARGLSLGALLLLAGACSATRPDRPNDLCSIFYERPEWYAAARSSYRRWGVPVPLQLAVIRHESGFDSDAKPPRTRILWLIPGPRPSSAYGYGQVLDGTWDTYQDSTGGTFADRDDFADVTDFIGWYGDVGERRFGIPRNDPYAFWLSYHEGQYGYARGTHRNKPSVLIVARKVDWLARTYESQYEACRTNLDNIADDSSWWPFG